MAAGEAATEEKKKGGDGWFGGGGGEEEEEAAEAAAAAKAEAERRSLCAHIRQLLEPPFQDYDERATQTHVAYHSFPSPHAHLTPSTYPLHPSAPAPPLWRRATRPSGRSFRRTDTHDFRMSHSGHAHMRKVLTRTPWPY